MKTKHLVLILILILYGGTVMAQIKNIVAKNAEDVCPVKIGTEIPNAIVKTVDNKEISLKEMIGKQKSIIIFYRGGWCPYCNLHLSELQSIEADLIKLGYKLIAISMDTPENLSATIDKHNLKYELYSDSKAEACKAFGIAFTVQNDYVNSLKSYNMDLEESSGEKHHILPVPSVFLTDENGIIKFEYVNPNYKERISGKLLLEVSKLY
ncbi:MAG: peroxiredoxin-like family protein [Ignavibacteriaceae bacterium]